MEKNKNERGQPTNSKHQWGQQSRQSQKNGDQQKPDNNVLGPQQNAWGKQQPQIRPATGPQQSVWGQQGQQPQRGPQQGQQPQRGPQQGQQVQHGPQQVQQPQHGPQQSHQPQHGRQQGQQPQRGPQQGQQPQRGPQQGQQPQHGPQQSQQPQHGRQQPQHGPQQGQQPQRGPQHGQQPQRGPQQGQQPQRGPQQGQQAQHGPQQVQQPQHGPQHGQQPQRGPQQNQQPQRGSQKGQQPQQGHQQNQQPQRGPQQGQQQQSDLYQRPYEGLQQQRSQQYSDGQSQKGAHRLGEGDQRKFQQSGQARSQPLPPMAYLEGDPVSCTGIKRGTIGKPGNVSVNYLEMDISKMPAIAYHYDVTVTPDKPKKFMRSALEAYRVKFLDRYCLAFDGKKSCYCNERLNVNGQIEEVEIADSNGRVMKFNVGIKETESVEIDLNSLRNYNRDRIFDKPMRALQCLEVVLSSACYDSAVRFGRSFFKRPDRTFELDDGYEAWTGLYQAAILGDKPFLNVDISNKSFPMAIPVVEYLRKYVLKCRMDASLDDYQWRDVEGFLKGINVLYEPPASFGSVPRTYRVQGMSRTTAQTHTFNLDGGQETTIAAYFASRKYRLRFPQLPCLQVGSTIKAVYLPMELCTIQMGQVINKKDSSRQVQNMIKFAATSTNERKRKIIELLQYFNHNAFPTINRFGITIGQNFIVVPTRLLPAPNIEYANSHKIRPNNGSWQMSEKVCFFQTKQPSASGHKWAIVHVSLQFNLITELAQLIKRQASTLRVSLQEKPLIEPIANLDTTFEKLQREKYDLVFVILPNKGPSYADVKQRAELKYGVLTQCIKQNTIQRRLSSILISNILLKVNAKLNGTNHKIEDASHINLEHVMYLGADVTHPAPDERHIPSVVGVAASHDKFGACYNMQYRLQKSTVENIEDMESIVLEHLRVYKAYQNRLPAHIIYYRDGVSDGQFPIVKRNELRGILNACAKLKLKVHLTCLIVVKRHHTRFFPDGEPNARNKFNNVAPGTVVDRVIVHPNEMQFFMVSHQSIQGTAKPTRYNVIENTAKLDVDLLQKLTYNMCHMFPRCNRVVSYPAPAYLAHLVAARGRVYIQGSRSQFANPAAEYSKRLINPNFMQRNPMYFV